MNPRRRNVAAILAAVLFLGAAFNTTERAHAAPSYLAVVLNALTGPDSVDIYFDGSLIAGGMSFGDVSGPLTLSEGEGHDGEVFESIASPPSASADRIDTPIEATHFSGDPRPGFIRSGSGPTVIRIADKGPGSRWFPATHEQLFDGFSCSPDYSGHGVHASADVSITDGYAGGQNLTGVSRHARGLQDGVEQHVVIRGSGNPTPTSGTSEHAFGSFDFGTVVYRIGTEHVFIGYGSEGTYGATEFMIDCATQSFVSHRSPVRNAVFPSSRFVSLDPIRLFDTRESPAPFGAVPARGTIDVQVAGAAGIPAAGVTAVVLNVTATNSRGAGYVTVFPTGSDRPSTSSLNFDGAGQTVPNLVTVPLGDRGRVSFFTLAEVDLLADVAGYFVAANEARAGRFVPVAPARVFDTREPPEPNVVVAAGESIRVPVLGRAGLPDDGVSAVVLNVTAVNVGGPSYVTVYPGGTARPKASNLNLGYPGDVAPNLVIVPVGDDGSLEFFSRSGDDVFADVFGYFTDGSAAMSESGLFVPTSPTRVVDSRPTPFNRRWDRFIAADTSLVVPLDGAGDIPEVGAMAALLNVTATESAAAGYVTLWPSDIDRPKVSNLNQVGAGVTRPNAVIVPMSAIGDVSAYSKGGVHAIVDVFGYFTS